MTKETEKKSNWDKLIDWITYRHEHDFEFVSECKFNYMDEPYGSEATYFCKGCGEVRQIRIGGMESS